MLGTVQGAACAVTAVRLHVLEAGRTLCRSPEVSGPPGHWPLFHTWVPEARLRETAMACADPEHDIHAVSRYEMCPDCMATRIAPDECVIAMWVIYDHPPDYPDVFVVRRQFTTPIDMCGVSRRMAPDGTVQGDLPNIRVDRGCLVARTLEDARQLIPPGLMRVDDPSQFIAEVWM